MKVEARIHSLQGGLDEVEILSKVGDNSYLVEYKGKRCSAIFNFFVGCYYVDDLYGVQK